MARNEKRIIREAIRTALAKEAMERILAEENKPSRNEMRNFRDSVVQTQRINERVVRELGAQYVGITVEFDLLISTVYAHFAQNHKTIKPNILFGINRILLEENETAYTKFLARKNKIQK